MAYIFLLAIGLLDMTGYLFGASWVQDLAALTVASPLPLVFTDRDGMEDFANRYTFQWVTEDSVQRTLDLTGREFSRLTGPFSRRGAYAAAVVYAPMLPETIWGRILDFGFCGGGPLSEVVGEKGRIRGFELTLSTRTRGKNESWKFNRECAR